MAAGARYPIFLAPGSQAQGTQGARVDEFLAFVADTAFVV